MASEADVRAIALSLPGTTEEQWYQTPGYKVAGKGFLRLRTEAEGGLVVFVSDMGEKEALLTSDSDAFFTTPHRTAPAQFRSSSRRCLGTLPSRE
jgi:hypothetical protein